MTNAPVPTVEASKRRRRQLKGSKGHATVARTGFKERLVSGVQSVWSAVRWRAAGRDRKPRGAPERV